jgi:hypothetical protein
MSAVALRGAAGARRLLWVRVSWPLNGRREEMHLIDATIVASDVCGIVVPGRRVWGRAVSSARRCRLRRRGRETRWAVGTSSARTLPLGAFAAWASSAGTDTVQLVRGVIESLTAAPAGGAVVVGVDDVHLLDDLSTFVIHQVVQRGRREGDTHRASR